MKTIKSDWFHVVVDARVGRTPHAVLRRNTSEHGPRLLIVVFDDDLDTRIVHVADEIAKRGQEHEWSCIAERKGVICGLVADGMMPNTLSLRRLQDASNAAIEKIHDTWCAQDDCQVDEMRRVLEVYGVTP